MPPQGPGVDAASFGVLVQLVQGLQTQIAQLQVNSIAGGSVAAAPVCAPDCDPIGAPRPTVAKSKACEPYMNPRSPNEVYGCKLPPDASAKDMCWVETTLRSQSTVAASETIRFSIEVKWWFQIQEITNLGEEAFATFDLVEIKYGQSNYDLKLQALKINGESTAQSGVDIRKWNQSSYASKYYPIPACGLDDAVELVFRNVSEDPQDLELLIGGPAVLQIG